MQWLYNDICIDNNNSVLQQQYNSINTDIIDLTNYENNNNSSNNDSISQTTNQHNNNDNNTATVTLQYIVMFKSYNTHVQHEQTIYNILKQCNKHDIKYNIIKRNYIHNNHIINQHINNNTDFVLLQCTKHDSDIIINILNKQTNIIRYVYLNKQVNLQPLYDSHNNKQKVFKQYNDNNNNDNNHNNNDDNNSDNTTTKPIKRVMKRTNNRHMNNKLDGYGINTESVVSRMNSSILWQQGYTGKNIRVAIFDTGLSDNDKRFNNIIERSNWTDELEQYNDLLGHGTFVAGIVASNDISNCPGFAPDSELHIYRIFNTKQLSYTTWFLDAFNYAIHSDIDILNLSIGGPDYNDMPFIDKINELIANNIIVISAIGNDGPMYGTLNNPADMLSVIGVGGIDYNHRLSTFSSRGMTTHELSYGYGRIKPDIVTYANNLYGTQINNGCKVLSGTSVASPVVTGIVTLLSSIIQDRTLRKTMINAAFIKQVLTHTAKHIDHSNIFEQGFGYIDLIAAYEYMLTTSTYVSLLPDKLDLPDCPYMWPYCTQPLYYTAMPVIVNLTVLNSISLTSYILTDTITYKPYNNASEYSNILNIQYTHSNVIWPYSGWLALHLTTNYDIKQDITINGSIELDILSETTSHINHITLPLTVSIISQPSRSQRILFDIYHNIRYPYGYIPRDSLEITSDTLDWHGDHIHTNYNELYTLLCEQGYYVEILNNDFTCFNSSYYNTLLLIDTEDEFTQYEIDKLYNDITNNNLNLIILADWYNTEHINNVKFYDDNTAMFWSAVTGGCNIPAINQLLYNYNIQYSDIVVQGKFELCDQIIHYASGNTIAIAPVHSHLLLANNGLYIVNNDNKKQAIDNIAIGVLYDVKHMSSNNTDNISNTNNNAGRIVMYGDSGCIDMSHRIGSLCNNFIIDIMSYVATGIVNQRLNKYITKELDEQYIDNKIQQLPQRILGSNIEKYSHTLQQHQSQQCDAVTYNNISSNIINDDYVYDLYIQSQNYNGLDNNQQQQQTITQAKSIDTMIIQQQNNNNIIDSYSSYTSNNSITTSNQALLLWLFALFIFILLTLLGCYRYRYLFKTRHYTL